MKSDLEKFGGEEESKEDLQKKKSIESRCSIASLSIQPSSPADEIHNSEVSAVGTASPPPPVKVRRATVSTCFGKNVSKAPKIQRLVTPLTLQRKRAKIFNKKKRIAKAKAEVAEYQKLLTSSLKKQRERQSESLAKKRSRLFAAFKPSIAACGGAVVSRWHRSDDASVNGIVVMMLV
ncbi:unnamed protein product [Fraxinus pennsylvanica]|uniref:Uncharacterized protein n=1 Tax=Fraxinus pennsylvanica TaxID=56036 RepID=A0AAD2ADR5_9LAMI|nr:unnamed protein product [Fraxinus pennsylvanica]